jgi:hypothetical protein
MISGDKKTSVSNPFKIKLSINLPFRQFIRIEYRIDANNIFQKKISYQKDFFHETITSGTLAVFTFSSSTIGTFHFRIKDLLLTDYHQTLQKMPDLSFKAFIQE